MSRQQRNQMPTRVDESLMEEAAEWYLRMSSTEADPEDIYPSVAARNAAFCNWYTRSARHLQAFLEICEVDYRALSLDPQHRIGIEAMLAQRNADVINLPQRGPWQQKPKPKWISVAVAATLAGLVATIAALWIVLQPHFYSTSVGEQRIVRLDDGSIVYLNTATRILVVYSKTKRSIRLINGEALFAVAHNPARAFVVMAENARVRALGTRFDVRDRANSVDVAVIEGAVQVTAADAGSRPPATRDDRTAPVMPVRAGELVHITPGRVIATPAPAPEDTISWLDRRLIFRNATLGEVAAEFNRYNRRQIKIEGAIAGQPMFKAAIFDADRPESLILYLSKDDALAVQPDGDDWIIRARAKN